MEGAAINAVGSALFEVGDTVVHPRHGIGRVSRLEEREFDPGSIQRYYEVTIGSGSTVWVPADQPNSGLRRLADRQEVRHCRKLLEGRAVPLVEDARQRHSQLAARLAKGTMAAQCEVVRDLTASLTHKPFVGAMLSFLDLTKGVLCQEWALVEGMTVFEAGEEIRRLLEKGKEA